MVCGSARAASRSRALLQALADAAPAGVEPVIAAPLTLLPLFSPDAEGPPAPAPAEQFLAELGGADLVVIAAPEYARTIPAVLKNALEWAVSRPEVIGKPVVLAHASHRGDEMLGHLRRVLETVAEFHPQPFLRLPLATLPDAQLAAALLQGQGTIASWWTTILTIPNRPPKMPAENRHHLLDAAREAP
jgi:NAD(P)H-dependent FMN reductase